jgi:DNA-binding MarR family transcriptional regulator
MTEQLGMLIILTYEDFERRMAHEFQASNSPDMRISDRHRSIFMHLSRFGNTRSVDLAKAVGIRKQSMMKLVHELESMGLITRSIDPTDARAKLIEMTPEGKKLERQFTESSSRVIGQYAEKLGKQNLRQLAASLATLNDMNGKGA